MNKGITRYSFLLILAAWLFSTISTYGQAKVDTVIVKTIAPDSTTNPDLFVEFEHNDKYYSAHTDSTGTVQFNEFITAIGKPKNPMIVKGYELSQSFPNPANHAEAKIKYKVSGLDGPQDVKIKIYNSLGQHVKTIVNDFLRGGEYQTAWDGTNEQGQKVAKGTYFYSLETKDGSLAKKLTYLGGAPTLAGKVNQLVAEDDGEPQALKKTAGGTEYDLRVTDPQQRFKGDSSKVTLSGDTTITKIMYEILQQSAPESLTKNVTDTVDVYSAWYQWKTGEGTVELGNPELWNVIYSDAEMLRIQLKDQGFSGTAPIELNLTGPHKTLKSDVITANLSPKQYNVTITPNTPDGSVHQNIKVTVGPDGVKYTGLDGSIDTSLASGDYNVNVSDDQGRFNPKDFLIHVEKDSTYKTLIDEVYNHVNNTPINTQEGAITNVDLTQFQYGTALDTVIIQNQNKFQFVSYDRQNNILQVRTVDPELYGTHDLELLTRGIFGSENDASVALNIENLVSFIGHLYNNNAFVDSTQTGPTHYGSIIDVGSGQVFYTDNDGRFAFKLPETEERIFRAVRLATGTQNDTTGYVRTRHVPGNVDNTDLKIKTVPFDGIEGQEDLFKYWVYVVNEKSSLPPNGMHYINQDNPGTNKYRIYKVNPYGDKIATDAEQDTVANHIKEYIHPNQPKKIGIVKLPEDSTYIVGRGGGRIHISIRADDIFNVGWADYDGDFKVDEVFMNVGPRKSDGFWNHDAMSEELASGEYGTNEMIDPIFDGFTVTSSGTGTKLTPADQTMRWLSKNFTGEQLEDILGGVKIDHLLSRSTAAINPQSYLTSKENITNLISIYEAMIKNPKFKLTPQALEHYKKIKQIKF